MKRRKEKSMNTPNLDSTEKKVIPKEKGDVVSLLFVAKDPLGIDYITKILHDDDPSIDENIVLRWIMELQQDFVHLGIVIQQVAGGFEMVTHPKHFDTISKIVPKTYETLRKSVLETVTIVALNQPAQRKTIQLWRNVKDPDNGIQGALELKLIKRTEEGYITTEEFLKYFKINDLRELPQRLKEISLKEKSKKLVSSEQNEMFEEPLHTSIEDANKEINKEINEQLHEHIHSNFSENDEEEAKENN